MRSYRAYSLLTTIEGFLHTALHGGVGGNWESSGGNNTELPVLKEATTSIVQDEPIWEDEAVSKFAWILLFYDAYRLGEGINAIAHKDLAVYIDPGKNENAMFAVENPDHTDEWQFYTLPSYGS